MDRWIDRGEASETGARWLIAIAAVYSLLFVEFAMLKPYVVYWFNQEDGVVEWLQVACLLVAAAFLAGAAYRHKRHGRPWLCALLGLGAFTFFFAAGEEISWGQRILGIQTPEAWAEINRQQETNLHNLAKTEIETWLKRGVAALAILTTLGLVLKWKRIAGIAVPGACTVLLLALSAVYRDFGQPYKIGIPVVACAVAVVAIFAQRRNGSAVAGSLGLLVVMAGVVYVGFTRVVPIDDASLNESRELVEMFAALGYAGVLFADAARSSAAESVSAGPAVADARTATPALPVETVRPISNAA